MRTLTALLALLVTLAIPALANATVIVGVDSTAGANWRTNAQLDVAGGSQYGTDGYVVYGINAADSQYLAPYAFNFDQESLPAYITGIIEPSGINMWSGNGNFGQMQDPGNGNVLTNTPLLAGVGGAPTYTIQRLAGAAFRLSILVASGDGANVTYTTTVTDSVDAATQSAGHTANGLRYHVYDVEAGTGDVLVTVAANNNFQVTGFAFDGGVFTPPPPVVGTLWSVDIQGSGSSLFGQSNPPLPMSGVEPYYGHGQVWNQFNVPAHNLPVQNDPSMALVDSTGNATGVTFTIHGPTAGWGGAGGSGGRLDLVRDYLFVNAGNVSGDLNADWTISGLDPTHTYELYAYGGAGRDMAFTVDLAGDGSFGNDVARIVDGNGLLFGPISPSLLGRIIGTMANGTGDPEGNWAGFQLRDITPVPEPSTFLMAALGLLGLVLCGRRWRKR